MEIKRTTEIFIAAKRRFVVRQASADEQIFCPECSSPMIAAEQFAGLISISRRKIYRTIEAGATHFVETETGAVMICPPSLKTVLRDGANVADNEKNLKKIEDLSEIY